jgi:hypothetical protein
MNALESVFEVLVGLLGIALLAVVYTYMLKLERVGCPCAEHPYADFIKKYSLFAMIFLAFLVLVPAATATRLFGEVFGFALAIIKILFAIATVMFYIYAIQYVSYLMREKCRCSEDMRREVMYFFSILMMAILAVLVIVPLFSIVRAASIGAAMNTLERGIVRAPGQVLDTAMNPVKNFQKASVKVSGVFKRK